MLNLMKVIDKANGYIYGGLSDQGNDVMQMMSSAVGADLSFQQYLFLFRVYPVDLIIENFESKIYQA